MRRILVVAALFSLMVVAPARADWSSPFLIDFSPYSIDEPSVMLDPIGNVWFQDHNIFSVWAPGGTPTSFVVPNAKGNDYITTNVDFAGDGTATFTYIDTNSNLPKAVRRSPGPTGTFGTPEDIPGTGACLTLDVNPSGGALIAWCDGNTVKAAYSPAGANTDFDDTPETVVTESNAAKPRGTARIACGEAADVAEAWAKCAFTSAGQPKCSKEIKGGFKCTSTDYEEDMDAELGQEDPHVTGEITCTDGRPRAVFTYSRSDPKFSKCGGDVADLEQYGSTCRKAEKLVDDFAKCRLANGKKGRCVKMVDGFACREVRENGPTAFASQAFCRRDEIRVRWAFTQKTV